MKKYFVWPIAVLLSVFSVNAQYVMKVTMKSGDVSEFNVSEIEDVTWQNAISDNPEGVHNGHEYVELGLPSGTKWATCNVGAIYPEEYGDYYAWGETETKETYEWSNYKWCKGSRETMTKYCTASYYGTVDNKVVLESSDDVAQVKWGGNWRMPTVAEMMELQKKCTWTWVSQNGMNGYKVTGPNGNSIFLPAAGGRGDIPFSVETDGYYMSSSFDTICPEETHTLTFTSSFVGWLFNSRRTGQSVRPICPGNDIPLILATEITLDKSNLSLNEDDTYTLSATVSPSNATYQSVTWSSSNPSVATVSASGVVTAVNPGTTTITATAYDLTIKEVTCIVTVVPSKNTEGEYNLHEYVDLGLSVKWATCNVGAPFPEGYGDYYAWGETETKDTTYDWSNYKWCKGNENTMTKYCTDSYWGTVDKKTILEPSDDVAQKKWGGSWRMPTQEELQELKDECTWTWTTLNNVNGYNVTSKKNGNSIFLPAAGFRSDLPRYEGSRGSYWLNTLNGCEREAYYLDFSSSDVGVYRYSDCRCFGHSVRPVCP